MTHARFVLAALAFALCCAVASAATVPVCTDCDFSGKSLGAWDFSGGVYVGTNFAGSVLERASFKNAKLVAANFLGADLRGAAFDGMQCTACNFLNAKLDGATFIGSRIVAANFFGFAAQVADEQLRGLLSGCVSCNFSASSLSGRDLSGSALIGVDLSQADLRGTKFDGAVLCWYAFDWPQRTVKCDSLKEARLDGASFKGVRVCTDPADAATCSSVDAATLRRYTGSNLSGAILP